jgi:hypothetical protein
MKINRRLVRRDRRRLYVLQAGDIYAEINLRPQGVRLG